MSAKALSITRWVVLAALSCIWLPCQAQFGSNVQGTVTDQTGAVIPTVAITLHNTSTGVDLKQTANASGFYRFEAVSPGDYTVIATQSGFKSESISVTVTPDETRGVDVTLVPAGGTVNVTVTTVAPILNPEETRIEITLASEEVTKLPMAGHDVQPVSYTHLDVYKRQAVGKADGGAGANRGSLKQLSAPGQVAGQDADAGHVVSNRQRDPIVNLRSRQRWIEQRVIDHFGNRFVGKRIRHESSPVSGSGFACCQVVLLDGERNSAEGAAFFSQGGTAYVYGVRWKHPDALQDDAANRLEEQVP